MSSPSKNNGISLWGWPLSLLLGIFFLDQLTKWFILRNFEYGASKAILPCCFNLVYFRNTGAAWSILSDYTWLLSLVSTVAFIAMIAFFKGWNKGCSLTAAAVAALIGGVAGNMVDRIFRGYVIDFLDFHIGTYHWPAFNVADSAICISIIILLVLNLIQGRKEAAARNIPSK